MIKPWIFIGICALVVTCQDARPVPRHHYYGARRSHAEKPKARPTPVIIEHKGELYELR